MAIRIMSAIRWLGCVFLLTSAILLLIASISAPTVANLGLFGVQLENSTIVNFGSFGYCYLDVRDGGNYCSTPSAGYGITEVLTTATGIDFSANSNVDGLTRGMVLHPIACGLGFISFLIAIASTRSSDSRGMAFFNVTILLLAWIFTTVVTAIDFSSINQLIPTISLNQNLTPIYGSALWCMMVAFIIQLLAAIIFGVDCYMVRKRMKALCDTSTPKEDGGRRV